MIRLIRMIKKILCGLGTGLAVLLSVLATIICFSIKWMFKTWSNLTIDELVYHLTAPLEGTNNGMIKEYLNTCIVPAILILMFILILFVAFRNSKRKYYIVMGAGITISLLSSAGFISHAWNNLEVGNYVKSQGKYSTFVDDNYIDPRNVEITFPEKKRNLIYIFLESMETTYADKKNGGDFNKNIIPELTELAQENEDFSGEDKKLNGGYPMVGATWTMGAMFAHTSGIPLSISIDINAMDTQDHFFSNTVTLGDILEKEGYSQTLMIGSDAVFGGRKLYFTEHGNYDILDYNYARNEGWIPEDYRVWWGYEDQKLFGFAKDKLTELAEEDNPFNFTLLTVDTHFEDGYPCELCPDIYGENQYANIMACSSRQIADFISWIQQQSFYDNTTIIITGDHQTMDSDFCKDVDTEYVRRVYTTYINAAAQNKTVEERNYTTFDTFPTVLASLGVEIEGDRLALGTNLFSEKPTLTERFGITKMQAELSRKSKMMEELADLNENNEELLINEDKMPTATVFVGAYDYKSGVLPVLVSDINNARDSIESIQIVVWTEADQSDLQWIPLEMQEDGSYFANVNVPNFNYKVGEYSIHAYMTDGQGDQYKLGETIGVVN